MTPALVQKMLYLGRWRHRHILQLAETLPVAHRYGSFHGRQSIAQVLAKGIEDDLLWLRRLEAFPRPLPPEGPAQDHFADWDHGRRLRQDTDARLRDWAMSVTQAELSGWLFWQPANAPERQMQGMEVYVLDLISGQMRMQGELGLLLQAQGVTWQGGDLWSICEDAGEDEVLFST